MIEVELTDGILQSQLLQVNDLPQVGVFIDRGASQVEVKVCDFCLQCLEFVKFSLLLLGSCLLQC